MKIFSYEDLWQGFDQARQPLPRELGMAHGYLVFMNISFAKITTPWLYSIQSTLSLGFSYLKPPNLQLSYHAGRF